MEIKYFKSDFTPLAQTQVWLFEVDSQEIKREIGLDKNNRVVFALPDKNCPRGLFGDSPVSFNLEDMEVITKEEFEAMWDTII
ncbi:hypothetical protein Q4E40_15705 [Pontibacter sp. BT731]|uniref:hypothetical protein n=1 Tax=Pontibacter coccineus TaxID=3063328 RepID=UPI0026E1A0D6|nr:hypothetical protein [Pontibacter sp. BT731]MDO6391582.1 hypothetical protein [Pontibacter sp. BT731]